MVASESGKCGWIKENVGCQESVNELDQGKLFWILTFDVTPKSLEDLCVNRL